MSTARDKRVADEFLGTYLPCSVCGIRSDRETLSLYGSRCDVCHQQWLAEAPTDHRPMTPQVRAEILGRLRQTTVPQDPRAWAHRLRDREARGERLSLVQRQSWREALGLPADAPATEEIR